MSDENFLIDGKTPLHTLRVVDLREELKKRGIKATGTKSHLQALLISAIQSTEAPTGIINDICDNSNYSCIQVDTAAEPETVEEKNLPEEEEEEAEPLANDSASCPSAGNSEQKFASISINEEKETIKLTIRCSPRKSEPSQLERSESESEPSPDGTSDSEDSSNARKFSNEVNDNAILNKDDTTQDSINTEQSINDSKESNEIVSNDVNDSTTEKDASKKSSNEIVSDDVNDSTSEKDASKVSEIEQVGTKVISEEISQDSINEESKDVVNDSSKEVDIKDTSDELSQDNNDSNDDNIKDFSTDITKVDIKSTADEVLKHIGDSNSVVLNDDSNDNSNENHQDDIKTAKAIKVTSSNIIVNSKDKNQKSLENDKNITNTVKNTNPAAENDLNTEKSNPNQPPESVESKIKPLRGRLLSQSKSINEDDPQKPILKKRRWGSSKASDSSLLSKGISSDKLKQLINESVVETVSPTKVSKSDSVNEDEAIETENLNDQSEEDNSNATKKDGIFVNDESLSVKTVPNVIGANVVEEVTEETEKSRSISPAKNPASTVLFITGLVRPYTLMQLKKLLSLTGTIEEEKFWIDKIKSKCYVAYSSMDEAIKTRESLHCLKWPQSSPKNLSVEFATFEDIDRCLHPENYEDLPIKSTHTNEKPMKLPDIEMGKGKFDIILNEAIRQPKEQDKVENKEQNSSHNIREWDRNKVNRLANKSDKEDDTRKRARYSSPIRKEHSRERSKSPEKNHRHEDRHPREAPKRSESPVKLLEDLFRKTKGTPYIYWLPLTDEQIVEKEKLRSKLEKEREERITARRDMGVNKRNDSPMNRPPPPINLRNVRDRPKVPEFRRRSPSPQFRRKRSVSPSPRNLARYSRSRSPDRRRYRFSPRRRR